MGATQMLQSCKIETEMTIETEPPTLSHSQLAIKLLDLKSKEEILSE
jgi:hypothetical protein